MSVPKEITDLIQSSGNSFHAKVARWLKDNGWHVTVSPYYMDQSQGKAREIDLVAERTWPVTGHFQELMGDLAVRLVIECKYVALPSVFWFADKDLRSTRNLICAEGVFRMNNTFTEKHHYLSQRRAAKLFASSTSKILENEPFYKALNQVLNGMISLRTQSVSIPEVQEGRREVIAVLEFPVVICSSFARIYSADFYNDSAPELLTDNFQFEVQYAYLDRNQKQRDDYFLLDFVEFDQLDKFMAAVEQDALIAVQLASPN